MFFFFSTTAIDRSVYKSDVAKDREKGTEVNNDRGSLRSGPYSFSSGARARRAVSKRKTVYICENLSVISSSSYNNHKSNNNNDDNDKK